MYVFLSFSSGLIFVIGMEGRFRRGWVRGPHVCISSSLITSGHLFVCGNGEKGYSDYRYDHVAFLGFRYYHSIEYTKPDWLKASCYRSPKIQTLSLLLIYFVVRKPANILVTQFSVKHPLVLSRRKCSFLLYGILSAWAKRKE